MFKTAFKNMARMNPLSRSLMRGGLMVTAAMLFSAALLLAWGLYTPADLTYLRNIADALLSGALAVFLESVLVPAMLQEHFNKQG